MTYSKHPPPVIAFPIFLCLPAFVRGMPVAWLILRFALVMPNARFQLISIHAPRVGSDFISSRQTIPPSLFQSTLPAWGATAGNCYVRSRSGISIHAPCVKSDRYLFGFDLRLICIFKVPALVFAARLDPIATRLFFRLIPLRRQ